MSGKLLEILKQIAPNVTRAAVIRDPAIPTGIGTFAAIQSLAPTMRVEVSPLRVQDPAEMEKDFVAFARLPNGGLIVTGSALAVIHRDAIVTLAARYKLPAVYCGSRARDCWGPHFLRSGFDRGISASSGLRPSHPQRREARRSAGASADEVRVGDQPQDRSALGLTLPPSLLATANEVIE